MDILAITATVTIVSWPAIPAIVLLVDKWRRKKMSQNAIPASMENKLEKRS